MRAASSAYPALGVSLHRSASHRNANNRSIPLLFATTTAAAACVMADGWGRRGRTEHASESGNRAAIRMPAATGRHAVR